MPATTLPLAGVDVPRKGHYFVTKHFASTARKILTPRFDFGELYFAILVRYLSVPQLQIAAAMDDTSSFRSFAISYYILLIAKMVSQLMPGFLIHLFFLDSFY
jgi:hypothetical protein